MRWTILLLIACLAVAPGCGGSDSDRPRKPRTVPVEGCNVVDIVETSPGNFTCKLATPPMPVPASARYNTPGDHHHNWFLLKIEGFAGETVTYTITNADWGGGGNGMWGRADGQAVWTAARDPHDVSAEGTWQRVPTASYASPSFTFTVTPTKDLAWVALCYPAMPAHTDRWIAGIASDPAVTAEPILVTPRGRPLWMVFITDPTVPLPGKRGVVVYGQEHMNEQTGGWTCQGMAEYLVSGDAVARELLRNVVFVVIPDMNPDATAAGTNCDPDDGKIPQWRYNPAAVDRLMPGMVAPMTDNSRAIWERLVRFVDDGGQIDFCFNVHQGGMDNWFGVYELADPRSSSLDAFLRSLMPVSGAPWVPNLRQGYSRGGWLDYSPAGPFAIRLLGRCWEEWRTVPMGYEISVGARADNFLEEPRGIQYFGEAIARAVSDYFGGFARSVTVGGPDGGESFASGGNATVTWSTTGTIPSLRIDLSTDGGASWANLVAGTPDDGSETVALPGADSSSCRVRVSDAAALGVSDESGGPFTIGSPPAGSVTVTSPDGGETWYAGWIETVTWTSAGTLASVRIEISDDGGVTWRRLAHAAANSGSYRVNVPGGLSSQCLVRVTAVENGAVADTSDAPFTIAPEPPWPSLTITSPDGGETWASGGTATVTWTSTSTPMGSVADVGISLSTDEGASWTTVVASTPNDGSETIPVPAVSSDRCLVWIYDARPDPWLGTPDGDPLDRSEGLFRIR